MKIMEDMKMDPKYFVMAQTKIKPPTCMLLLETNMFVSERTVTHSFYLLSTTASLVRFEPSEPIRESHGGGVQWHTVLKVRQSDLRDEINPWMYLQKWNLGEKSTTRTIVFSQI